MSKPSFKIGGGNWAVREGRLLAERIGESSKKLLSYPLPFRRASNLACTRTTKKGLIEKGRHNILRGSNRFGEDGNATTAPWSKNGISNVNDGFEGYDGTNHAWKVIKNAKAGRVNQSIASTSGVKTFSVYAKPDLSPSIVIRVNPTDTNDPHIAAVYNLRTETRISLSTGAIGSRIEDVGNGWYRVSLTIDDTINIVRIYPADSEGSVSTTTGSIFLQDAQLEVGHSTTDYIETGSITNLLSNTEEFTTVGSTLGHGWYKTGSTVTHAEILGYDGSHRAWVLTKSATHGRIHQLVTRDANTKTFSIYAKAKDEPGIYVRLDEDPGGGTLHASFNLETGEIIGQDSDADLVDVTITSVGDEWYRITMTTSATQALELVRWGPCDSSGDTDQASGSIYFQAPQLEKSSSATTYSPTGNLADITNDSPIIDYLYDTPQFVMRPRRTNLVLHSEGLDSIQGYINDPNHQDYAVRTHAELDQEVVNPMGYKGGVVKLTNLLGNAGDRTYYKATTIADTQYGASFYIKGTKGESINYYGKRIQVNNEAIGAGTLKTKIDLTGEWQRVDQTFTSTSTLAGIFLVKDGSSTADTAYVWGGQIEQGTFTSDYIPTYGATVERLADQPETLNNDLQTENIIKSNQGTLFIDARFIGSDSVQYDIRQNELDGSYNIQHALRIHLQDNGDIGIYKRIAASQTKIRTISAQDVVTEGGTTFAEGDNSVRVAIAWKGTTLLTSVNGADFSDTVTDLQTAAVLLDTFRRTNSNHTDCRVNKLEMYDHQLTAAELNTLTA